MLQLDLLSGSDGALPSVDELAQRFTAFNRICFGARLPNAVIRWSNRMRIAGTCERHRGVITLSRRYHEQFPADVDDTLKHEMIHLRYRGHGSAFRREAQRLGVSLHCREYAGLHPKATLRYVCPKCHHEYRRMKAGELYCGRCSRRHIDPSCRLVLVNSSRHNPPARRPLADPKAPTRERRRDRSAADNFQITLF